MKAIEELKINLSQAGITLYYEDGTIKEKKQQVRPSIYRIAQDLEKLPYSVENTKVMPHQVIVDFGNIRTVKGFRIFVKDANDGCIKDFRLYGRPQFFLYE